MSNETKTASKRKRLKHGTLAVTFTVIFVAAIVLLNVIFNLVLDRFDISADLSDKAIYSIEQSTADYLAGVEDDVEFIVTTEQSAYENSNAYFKQTSEIIQLFAASNPRFRCLYYDLDSNPAFFASYGNTLSAGNIIVRSGNTGRYVILTTEDYLNPTYSFNGEEISYNEYYQYYSYGMSSYLSVEYYAAAEMSLLSTVMNVSNPDPVRVAVASGFGESTPTALLDLLGTNAFVTETLDVALASEISSEYDYLLIYAPLYDYSNDALNIIDAWLDNGGKYNKNLIFVPASTVDSAAIPKLCAFLDEWGISLGSGYVYQTSSDYAYVTSPVYQYLNVLTTDYSDGVDTASKFAFGGALKPITLRFDEYSNYATTAILSSYEGSVIMPFESEGWQPSDATETNPYNVLVESSKTAYEGIEEFVSRVFVFGGDTIVGDFMTASQTNNAELVLNIFNKTSGREDTGVSLTPKSFSLTTFEITGTQAQAITIVFVVVVPVIIIAAGIFVIVRRKRR